MFSKGQNGRSFMVKKFNVSNAAESRRNMVEKNYLLHNTIEFTPKLEHVKLSNHHSFDVENGSQNLENCCLGPIAEPLDVEEILSSRMIARGEVKEPNLLYQRLRDMLERDVEICLLKKSNYFQHENIDEKEIESGQLEPHIRDFINFYNRDYVVEVRKFQMFSTADSMVKMLEDRSTIACEKLTKQIFESDLCINDVHWIDKARKYLFEIKRDSTASANSNNSSSSSQSKLLMETKFLLKTAPNNSDPIVQDILAIVPEKKLDEVRNNQRQQNRCPYLVNLLSPPNKKEIIEWRSQPPPPYSESLQRLSLKITHLSLEPNFEPIFASVALFDITQKQRLSENFYFDFNSDDTLSLLKVHLQREKSEYPISKCKQALFSLNPGNDLEGLFLVFKLEKILQKSESIETYLKVEKGKLDEKKLVQSAKEYCERLGAYRSQIGWMAVDIKSVVENAQKTQPKGHQSFTDSFIRTYTANDDETSLFGVGGNIDPNKPESDNISLVSADRFSISTTGQNEIACETSALRKVCSSATIRNLTNGTSGSNTFSRQTSEKYHSQRSSQRKKRSAGSVSLFEETMPEDPTDTKVDQDSVKRKWRNALQEFQPLSITISLFHAETSTDDELINQLLEARKQNGSKQQHMQKRLPVDLRFELSVIDLNEIVTSQKMTVISPDLLPLNFSSEKNHKLQGNIIARDILTFPIGKALGVNSFYRNLLYIYPKSVNMTGCTKNARNITVKVELMNGTNGPLSVFYGKSSERQMSDRVLTSVTYHSKYPQFSDEFKFQMPLQLQDGHHLRFTFYHISCKPVSSDSVVTRMGERATKQAAESVETIIGYTWLPLQTNWQIQVGDHALPISLDPLPPSMCYLSPHVNMPNVRWLDGHKPLFNISLKLISSVHAQDKHFANFCATFYSLTKMPQRPQNKIPTDEEIKSSILNVLKIRPEPLLSYLYIILDKLLTLLTMPTPFPGSELHQYCFETICQLAKIATMLLDENCDEHGRSRILTAFVHHCQITQGKLPMPGPTVQKSPITTITAEPLKPQIPSLNASKSQMNGSSKLTNGLNSNKTCNGPTSNGSSSRLSSGLTTKSSITSSRLLHGSTMKLSSNLPISKLPTNGPSSRMPKTLTTSMIKRPPIRSAKEEENLSKLIKSYEEPKLQKPLIAQVEQQNGELDQKLLHEEIARLFVASFGTVRETACVYAWFLLELLYKAMGEYLAANDRFVLPRKLRFQEQFLQDLKHIARILLTESMERAMKNFDQALSINKALAFFLRDSCSLISRTFVFQQVYTYSKVLNDRISVSSTQMQTQLIIMKLQFLRILCSHEHFILFNLPFKELPQPKTIEGLKPGIGTLEKLKAKGHSSQKQLPRKSSITKIPKIEPSKPNIDNNSSKESSVEANTKSDDFYVKHFLLGIVLSDLNFLLKKKSSLSPNVQSICIEMLQLIIASHETDTRLTDPDLRQQIAAMYFPLIDVCIDLFDENEMCGDDYGMANSGIFMTKSRTEDELYTMRNHESSFFDLKGPQVKKLLVCVCWVLKNVDQSKLLDYLRILSTSQIVKFIRMLRHSLSSCEYKFPLDVNCNWEINNKCSNTDQSSEGILDSPGRSTTVTGTGLGRRRQSDGTQSSQNTESDKMPKRSGEFFHERSEIKDQIMGIKWRKDPVGRNMSKKSQSQDDSHVIEWMFNRQMATEVTLNILECVETLVKVFQLPSQNQSKCALPEVFRLVLYMLSRHNSIQALENIFASQRSLVQKFPQIIFDQHFDLCAKFFVQLLKYFTVKLPEVRSQAAASLYCLLRTSYQQSLNFFRLKKQIIVSLSELISNNPLFGFVINEQTFKRSIQTFTIYLENDVNSASKENSWHRPKGKLDFVQEVKQLALTLEKVFSDTVKMNAHANDYEMTIELMSRIAWGYRENSDLRISWLINIANKHIERHNFIEAAHCYLHCCAIVTKYFTLINDLTTFPKDLQQIFTELSDNIEAEFSMSSAEKEDLTHRALPDSECTYFSLKGFIDLVEKCAQFVEKAQMHELVLSVYKLITPILETQNEYAKLAEVHQNIAKCLNKLDSPIYFQEDIIDPFLSPLRSADKRCFGSYFRVKFFGSKFGDDLDKTEFVYKEPSITKLSEISHRLESFYASQFGKHNVELIKDSNDINPDLLNPEKAYLQITYVEPNLEPWEKKRRQTYLQRNYKIYSFIYATPFTTNGKAHGTLKDQYKRKTILTTEYSFPYVKTRLRVVKREQIVLTPIEVAIEDIQKRTRELASALANKPTDAKMLQMVLQGCIGTTVNQGPLEIAKVFLANVQLDEQGQPKDQHQNKLRLCFVDFVNKCSDALEMNEGIIEADRADYQRELRKNFETFTTSFALILEVQGCSVWRDKFKFKQ